MYHNTKTTTWDGPRLPSTLDANMPQYKRDFRGGLICLWSQPGMRNQPGNCQIKVRRNHILEDEDGLGLWRSFQVRRLL